MTEAELRTRMFRFIEKVSRATDPTIDESDIELSDLHYEAEDILSDAITLATAQALLAIPEGRT